MKRQMLGLVFATITAPLALASASAGAQNWPQNRQSDRPAGYRERDWSQDGEWRRWRNYDYNRPATGNRFYYADDYYRDGRDYRPLRISRNTRLYRGRDGRYYCRRDDGTTGLVVGAALGALVGAGIDRGRSNLAGVLIGGSAGALLGREIDRGGLSCR